MIGDCYVAFSNFGKHLMSFQIEFNNLTSVSHLSDLLYIDHKFRHNIVKVAQSLRILLILFFFGGTTLRFNPPP